MKQKYIDTVRINRHTFDDKLVFSDLELKHIVIELEKHEVEIYCIDKEGNRILPKTYNQPISRICTPENEIIRGYRIIECCIPINEGEMYGIYNSYNGDVKLYVIKNSKLELIE